MEDYIKTFLEDRKITEDLWEKRSSEIGNSKFDSDIFYNDEYSYLCLNAKKYTYEQALEEAKVNHYRFVVKSFVRHRYGNIDGDPCSVWFCGDDEYSNNCVPVWTLTDDDCYGIGLEKKEATDD